MKYDNDYAPAARIQDGRKYKHLVFIRHEVDDARLTQAEFRVYIHLIRRAGMEDHAYPGIDSVSETCLMSKHTAIKAIRSLEKLGMISVRRKIGERNVYYISDEQDWKTWPPVQSKQRSSAFEVTPPVQYGERKIHHKDTPSKKGSFSIEKREEEDDIPF